MKTTALLAVLLASGIVTLAPRGLAELDFRRAEARHRAGDAANALTACESALRRRPDHPGARALIRILRPPYRCGNSSADGMVLGLLDRTIEDGLRFLDRFELEAAEGQFRLASKLASLMPAIPGTRAREDAARGGLARIAAMLEDR